MGGVCITEETQTRKGQPRQTGLIRLKGAENPSQQCDGFSIAEGLARLTGLFIGNEIPRRWLPPSLVQSTSYGGGCLHIDSPRSFIYDKLIHKS
jgi:hypothetical protein